MIVYFSSFVKQANLLTESVPGTNQYCAVRVKNLDQ